MAVAAAFHDLGIWTAVTSDYLPPSLCAPEIQVAIIREAGSCARTLTWMTWRRARRCRPLPFGLACSTRCVAGYGITGSRGDSRSCH